MHQQPVVDDTRRREIAAPGQRATGSSGDSTDARRPRHRRRLTCGHRARHAGASSASSARLRRRGGPRRPTSMRCRAPRETSQRAATSPRPPRPPVIRYRPSARGAGGARAGRHAVARGPAAPHTRRARAQRDLVFARRGRVPRPSAGEVSAVRGPGPRGCARSAGCSCGSTAPRPHRAAPLQRQRVLLPGPRAGRRGSPARAAAVPAAPRSATCKRQRLALPHAAPPMRRLSRVEAGQASIPGRGTVGHARRCRQSTGAASASESRRHRHREAATATHGIPPPADVPASSAASAAGSATSRASGAGGGAAGRARCGLPLTRWKRSSAGGPLGARAHAAAAPRPPRRSSRTTEVCRRAGDGRRRPPRRPRRRGSAEREYGRADGRELPARGAPRPRHRGPVTSTQQAAASSGSGWMTHSATAAL